MVLRYLIVLFFIMFSVPAQALQLKDIQGYWTVRSNPELILLFRQPYLWYGLGSKTDVYRFEIAKESRDEVVIFVQLVASVDHENSASVRYYINQDGSSGYQGAYSFMKFSISKKGVLRDQVCQSPVLGDEKEIDWTETKLAKLYQDSFCNDPKSSSWLSDQDKLMRPVDQDKMPFYFQLIAPELLPWNPHRQSEVRSGKSE